MIHALSFCSHGKFNEQWMRVLTQAVAPAERVTLPVALSHAPALSCSLCWLLLQSVLLSCLFSGAVQQTISNLRVLQPRRCTLCFQVCLSAGGACRFQHMPDAHTICRFLFMVMAPSSPMLLYFLTLPRAQFIGFDNDDSSSDSSSEKAVCDV